MGFDLHLRTFMYGNIVNNEDQERQQVITVMKVESRVEE